MSPTRVARGPGEYDQGPTVAWNARRALGGAALALSCSACAGPQSALDVRGTAAARIAGLWWTLLVVAVVVYIIVIALLLATIARRVRETGENGLQMPTSDRRGLRWIGLGGVLLPALVLAAVLAVTLRVQTALHSHTPADLTVQVIGRLWWWEIRYLGGAPGDRVITANELHIPTGRRVRVELTSADMIHSFWVPNLQGKVDLVPGRTTVTWLHADRPGISRGQCAEYCGLQHTRMGFLVVAEPPAEFTRWLDEQRRPSAAVNETTRRGQVLFQSSGCAYCHATRPVATPGVGGPDLTHFASRRTIAAATLPNTRGHLAGWIADPQGIKPGNRMPRIPLAPADLLAVVTYLESLR